MEAELATVEQIEIGRLRPNARNPRVNDHAVDAVARSIQAFGFNNPIITDGDLNVAAGHTRLKAAHALGLETVPVLRVPDLVGSKFTGYCDVSVERWEKYTGKKATREAGVACA